MNRPVPAPIRWLLGWLPAEWRESVEGDLLEERARRRARRQSTHVVWMTTAAALIVWQIAVERAAANSTGRPPHGKTQKRSAPMHGFFTDLTHAAKRLLAQPGYALPVVLTLAIGIGANTAVFTLANWVLLRPIPGVVADDQLVTIGWGTAAGSRGPYAFTDLQLLRAGVASLSGLAGFTGSELHVARPGQTAERITSEIVTGNYFAVLGQPVIRGRAFTTEEADRAGGDAVLVISDRLWRRAFGAAEGAVNAPLIVNGQPFTVVGITARGFHGASRTGNTDVWVPIGQHRAVAPSYTGDVLGARGVTLLFSMFGRLAPGASLDQVSAQTEAIRVGLAAQFPKDRRLASYRYIVQPGLEARPWVRDQLARTMTLLGGFVLLLLVLTCANVANLMLARTSERQAEVATRLALGASRARVARLLLSESLLLSTTAAISALGAAWLLARAFEGTALMQGLPPMGRAELDWRVLAFALAAATMVAVAAGVLPAIRGSRVDLRTALVDSARTHTGDRRRIQRLLTITQVAVSVTLLIGAGLLARSMAGRLAIGTGFDPSSVLSFSIDPGMQGYVGARQAGFYRELLDRVGAVPGVRAAGLAWLRLFAQGAADTQFSVEGGSETKAGPGDGISTSSNMVSPGFFAALGLPFVQGRDFTAAEFHRSDAPGDGVVILTESLARKAFGTAPAVGRRVVMAYPEGRVRTVIGVVRDTRQRRLVSDSAEMLFEPFGQTFPSGWASVVVGLAAPASAVVPAVRQAVATIDPNLPIYDIVRLDDAIRHQFSNDLLVMRLTLVFATLATVVAAIGLYGVLARSILVRRRELGVRAALGASPLGVAAQVLRESAFVLIVGLLVAAPLAWWLVRFVESRLFGVTRFDPLSIVAAVAVVLVVAAVATVVPARRAARIDPVDVLR